MKKILYLALLSLLAASCGDSADPIRAQPMDAAPDGSKVDTAPASPDVPPKRDIAPTPDAPNDVPFSPELFLMPIDVPPAVEHPGPGLDGPAVKLDVPEPLDIAKSDHYDDDVPGPLGVDGPASPTDAETRTLRSPDGRTWTVIMVDACYGGAISTDSLRNSPCTATYAEGRDRATTPLDGSYAPGTAAGRCAEGSYVYAPYRQLESMFCYYDAVTQKLVGYRSGHDTTSECGKDGTASNSWAYGEIVPCSNITWEISRSIY